MATSALATLSESLLSMLVAIPTTRKPYRDRSSACDSSSHAIWVGSITNTRIRAFDVAFTGPAVDLSRGYQARALLRWGMYNVNMSPIPTQELKGGISLSGTYRWVHRPHFP